jgi:hypothetical protein
MFGPHNKGECLDDYYTEIAVHGFSCKPKWETEGSNSVNFYLLANSLPILRRCPKIGESFSLLLLLHCTTHTCWIPSRLHYTWFSHKFVYKTTVKHMPFPSYINGFVLYVSMMCAPLDGKMLNLDWQCPKFLFCSYSTWRYCCDSLLKGSWWTY